MSVPNPPPFPNQPPPLPVRVEVDDQHPWLGLEAFTEKHSEYFYGRAAEAEELFRRVKRDPLTVLFGMSGLGKTSLVRAGLFPALRAEGFLPVYIRLDHELAAKAPKLQVTEALTEAITAARISQPTLPETDETLWEFFHRDNLHLQTWNQQPITPVLVFDQFEELFTLGARDKAAKQKYEMFFTELSDLVENHPPARVRERLRTNPEQVANLDFGPAHVRVLFSLREDYLANLETYSEMIPSISRNRMRLTRMNGQQALDAVILPGVELVSSKVGEQIVRFVAAAGQRQARADGAGTRGHGLQELDVEPALLSLFCRELNGQRIAQGLPQITDDLVEKSSEQILQNYYEGCFVGQAFGARIFVEEELLTRDGHRDDIELQRATDVLKERGAAATCLEKLIDRRLLHLTRRGETLRVELTHDVLTGVVGDSRNERHLREADEQRLLEERRRKEAEQKQREAEEKQREAEARERESESLRAQAMEAERRSRKALRRSRIFLILAILGLVFAVFYAFTSAWNKKRAEEQSAVALKQKNRADNAARDATIAAKQAEEMSKEALREKERADEAAQVAKKSADSANEETERANKATKAAEQSASRAQEQLARAQIEEGHAWIERAKLNSDRGDHFAAALMAARSLGFAGYGREKIVDPKFNEEYPVLLSAANDPIDEQEARREINEATLTGYFGWPLWQTPVYRQHEGPVESVAWSPDGKTLASGSNDQTVKLWDAATGKLLTSLQGHTGEVCSVAWSPDGKTLASGSSDDQTVKLWDAATGKVLSTLQGHTGAVWSVAWSPDGKTLASGSGDKTVKLWEAATGKLLTTLQGHTGEVCSVAWSPDGKTLASGSFDHTVKLWEAATGKLLTSLHGHTESVWSVAWSPDGKTLASGSRDLTMKLWEVATGKVLSTLQGHTGAVRSVAWSPDGKTLASGSFDHTVKLWDAATGKVLSTLQGHTGQVYSVAWSPDGKTLASGSSDQTVKIWEAATGKLLSTLQGHIDLVSSVAWSPDGKTLASGSGDQTVKIWEAASGKVLSTLQGHTDWVNSLVWSPDGKTLASGCFDHTVKLWEAATGKLLSTLQGHTGQVYSVAWSPDGKTLASISLDQTVKLWETATSKLLTSLQGHNGGVTSVSWSPDGKTLASGSVDGTVKLWDAATGKPLSTLLGHNGPVWSIAWSPDGKTLASGSADHTVKLWEGPDTSEIDWAEYLRSRWIRLVGSEMVWEVNKNLLRDRSFDVVNLPRTTLLGIERSGLSGSQKLREQLSLLLHAGNCPEAIAIWKATSAKAIDSPIRRMLLASLSAFAADDLFSKTRWRGLWLTEQMQSMITSEAMLDPAVSLGTLRLCTQLALAGSDETKVVSVRESFNARIAGMAPRSWFVALGRNVVAAATEELRKRSAGEEGRKLLQDAVAAYRSALEVRSKADLPQDWAATQYNLGYALQELGTRSAGEEGRKLLQDAVAAYRSALEVRSKADLPQDWAATQNNLGYALQELGTRSTGEEGSKLLQDAVAAYRSALEVYTKADPPQDWAATQYNLGYALQELGTRSTGEEGRKLLQDAAAAYRSALEVRTKADLPQVWAATQNNLGNVLQELGTRSTGEEGHKLLQDAAAAYRSALEIRTKADLPQVWAATQNNLGYALQELGTRSTGEEGRKLLQDAAAAYRSALEVYTKADLPQIWAQTQNNLSDALGALGNQLEGEEGLKRKREAVELLRDVVSYQPDDLSRYRLASALGGLAFNLVLDSQFAEAQTRCEEAQRLANEIGDGVQKNDRDNLIFIQSNLAHALLFQGHYDEALAIYRQYWDKPLNGKTFGEVTLEDFAAFDKAGLTHPDLSRMKQALSDSTSKSPSPR